MITANFRADESSKFKKVIVGDISLHSLWDGESVKSLG